MKLFLFDIWLDVGRTGRTFTYIDGLNLNVSTGDIVLVYLRGRPLHGLVVHKYFEVERSKAYFDKNSKKINYSNIEEIIQKGAVTECWKNWIDDMALLCCTTPFKMLKTALPPYWLGKIRKNNSSLNKKLWWVELVNKNEEGKNFSKRQIDLVNFLKSKGGGTWLKDTTNMGFSRLLVNKMIEGQKLIKQKKIFQKSCSDNSLNICSSQKLENPKSLTFEQKEAINVYGKLDEGQVLLLWGITGSGKTEVYLQIVEREFKLGRHCMILAPEIGLIPQLVDRFKNRFGNIVYEYHSQRTEKERISVWINALSAKKPIIIVGTRSAVFLPLSPLGVIILDEEHDCSYKQESQMPCYHARTLSIERAKRTKAKVILGSATPSLTSWKNLGSNNQFILSKLTKRISQCPLPRVQIIDMRTELAKGNRRLLSSFLKEKLQKTKDNKEQAIILVPKRGYSSFLSCRSCGNVVNCPNCDVSLTVHLSNTKSKYLRCHWCDYRSDIKGSCSECGSSAFKPFGAGTQRVMENLVSELDGLKVLRFDKDTTSGKDGHRKLLEEFSSGKFDVLIGTQMLAKGIDMPRVTLAAVLAADGLLHRPDLFAEEHALQLFMQLAGRAGRSELPGEVIVQTYCPDHPVLEFLKEGSYEKFLKKESIFRERAGLAPYRQTCLLRLTGTSENITFSSAKLLASKLNLICKDQDWQVIGPAPSPISRINRKSRWQILLHGPESSEIPKESFEEIWELLPKEVSLLIDPEPIQL